MVQTNEVCVSKILGPKNHIDTDQFSWGWIVYLLGYSVPNMHAQPYPNAPWLKVEIHTILLDIPILGDGHAIIKELFSQ